jgi:hypothetical protein
LPNEPRRIAESDDLDISPFREDGATYGTPTWALKTLYHPRILTVSSRPWYQAALAQRAGRIRAAGMTKEVIFEPADGPINNQIDVAYRAKYGGSPYLTPMIGKRARSATVRLLPRKVTRARRTGLNWRIAGLFLHTNLVGAGCCWTGLGPRLGTLLGTPAVTPMCASLAHVLER